ncbi:MAG TPA: tRNA pseudouridine(38-40) synthase TruA [Thermoanaerobaculia bacterium]|nr:tRNA pseudouridine(38-40) synthase TruA [Thermoanaerobaculia bacterium]
MSASETAAPPPLAWRLTVSYRGDRYAGWQRQDNAVTVQQVLEEALAALLGEPVRATGAGRTDAGVHARGQVVSLGAAAAPGALIHGTNARLPDDVRVLAAAPAPAGFHARKHALAKEYRYHLSRAPVLSPLDAPFVVRVDPELDVAAMRQAAALLVGRHDFTAFAKVGGSPTQPFRRLDRAEWLDDGEALTFVVAGEGFLRGMVRGLVGTMLEVGRGRRTVDSFVALLAGRARAEAGPNAPAHGLVLQRVDYSTQWLAAPAVSGP